MGTEFGGHVIQGSADIIAERRVVFGEQGEVPYDRGKVHGEAYLLEGGGRIGKAIEQRFRKYQQDFRQVGSASLVRTSLVFRIVMGLCTFDHGGMVYHHLANDSLSSFIFGRAPRFRSWTYPSKKRESYGAGKRVFPLQ